MSETDELLSYMSLIPHIKVLRACGIYPLDSNCSRFKNNLHTAYMGCCFSFVLLYTVQQIIHVYQVRADVDEVMDSMFLLLTYFDCICKQVVFLNKSHQILELIEIMKGPYFNQKVEEHRPFLLKTINEARFLLRVFNRLCIVTCFLWVLFPIITHWKQEPVIFTIWVPFDANKDPHFYIVICYVWLQTSWLGYNNSTMDIFIVYLFAQTKTQLSILRVDLENLVAKCNAECKKTSAAFNNVLERRLKGIIDHYNEIIRVPYSTRIPYSFAMSIHSFIPKTLDTTKLFIKLTDGVFNAPILFQFLVSGWIICTTTYRTVNMSPASGEFFSMILYMICILSELFLFCFYGNEVAYESGRIMESACCSDWMEMPLKYRRFLIIFMERMKTPILPKAGKIVPLSMNTFIQIIKTSYTLFTFLDNAEKK